MEQLGYTLVYLAKGSLPWIDCKGTDNKETDDLMKNKKKDTSI